MVTITDTDIEHMSYKEYTKHCASVLLNICR